jgi:hypothetical protein
MRVAYETATAEPKELLDKRDAIKRNLVVNAIMKSTQSLDEIMAFIEGEFNESEEEEAQF